MTIKSPPRKKVGRPNVTGGNGADYVTTKFTRAQLVKIDRLVVATGAGRAAVIRMLVDAGIATMFHK